MRGKRICVVSQDFNTANLYADQIKDVMTDLLYVDTFSFDSSEFTARARHTICSADVVLATCETIKNYLEFLLAEQTPRTIIAKTTLNDAFLTRLVQLPHESNALVVTCFRETAIDTIRLLKNYGFTGLNYHPYYPGIEVMPDKQYSVAITTGVPHLVPNHITEIIDIGIRKLDISTMVEILLAMDLSLNLIDDISHNYIVDLLNLSKQYKNMAEKVIELNRQLEAVINSSEDGIVVVDKEQTVIFINLSAVKILGLDVKSDYIGTSVLEIIPNIASKSNYSILEKVITINHEKILLNEIPISIGEQTFGTVINLKLVSTVQKLEKEVRAHSLNTGHFASFCSSCLKIKSTRKWFR